MASDQIKEMISAFAIGCMDDVNYKNFRSHLEKKGNLPKGELGDLQNIIALIPTILNVETPRNELKDELNKRVAKIQNDISNRVTENRRETRIDEKSTFTKRDTSTKTFALGKNKKEAPKSTVAKEEPRPIISTPIPAVKQNKASRSNNVSTSAKPTTQQKKTDLFSDKLHWIFSGLLALIMLILFFIFSSKTSELEEKNTKLENKVIKLNTELSQTNSFVNQNMEFVEFFNNPYIEIIPLKGAKNNSSAMGRLFISFNSGEGLLQLQNMPRIDSDMNFRLWLVSINETFSLGTFEVKPDRKYMPFSEVPFMVKEDIKMFRVTKEKKGEVLFPNGETVLFGTLREPRPTVYKRRKKRRRR